MHNKAEGVAIPKLSCKAHVTSSIKISSMASVPRGGSGVVSEATKLQNICDVFSNDGF